ncbi:MAG: DsrE family protein [Prolixibacteraceae bacterium]
MKAYILLISLLFSVLISGNSLAQNPTDSTIKNYTVLTMDIQQLKSIVLAASDLSSEDGDKFGAFKVIICGKTVTDLIQKDKITPYLEMAEKYHVELYACELSLKQFKVNPKDLPKQIQVTKNGILYNFQLQKKGYLSIEL